MKITHRVTFGLIEFVERQLQTKTGRTQILALLAAWGAYFSGTLPPHPTLTPLYQAIAATFLCLTFMFQRDKEAKAEAADRRKAKRVYRGGGK
jgi:hypothetical protein